MRKSIQADELRNKWYGKFEDARSSRELGEMTNVGARFRPWDIPRAGSNAMSQFAGSARGEARYNPEQETVTFMLHNPTSMKSLMYGQGRAWERDEKAPGGNMRQAYVWKEKLDKKRLGLD
ncbi:MAG: hypothetical protein ACOCVM_01645 [Desulfovibrionaceae bacterium]